MAPEYHPESTSRARFATVLGSADRETSTTDYLVNALVDGLRGDITALQSEVTQLRQAIATRAPIEQAKGVLMLRYGIDADEAFGVLVRISAHTNIKVRSVATVLVGLASGSPAGGDISRKILHELETHEPSNTT